MEIIVTKGEKSVDIEFRDLRRQYDRVKSEIDERITSIIGTARFISGPEVKELESELASYVGRKYCISCANGTDAISIALMSAGVGEAGGGCKTDAVFVPDFTFFSSGECPASVGATPVFVDVSAETYNIDPVALENTIKRVLMEDKLKPRAVVAVDLFGRPFGYDAVRKICDRYDMVLIEDAAQGFGGCYTSATGENLKACKLGDISTTSFFPAKPLGCYGDGGAIFTDDDEVAMLCRSVAIHGKDMGHPDDPEAKYNNIRLGMNSRLDTLQAGVLLAKFPAFRDEELDKINHVASLYNELLSDVDGLILPNIDERCYSSWAQYTVQLPDGVNREEIRNSLRINGIPTGVYYPKPMHKQGAFSGTLSSVAECPVTEKLCETVLCLPIHPYLTDDEVEYVVEKMKEQIFGV